MINGLNSKKFTLKAVLAAFGSTTAMLACSRGLRDSAAAGFASAGSANDETKRLVSVNRLRERVVASRELPRLANLRDGALMPPESRAPRALHAWGALLLGGLVFWTWALPKVMRAVADGVVISANTYY